jgi:putative ABC transport system permease protein
VTAATWRTVLRVLRIHRQPLVAIASMTLLAAFVGGSALPVLDALASAGIHADLHRATDRSRDLEATFAVAAPEGLGEDPQQAFDGVAGDLAKVHRDMPAELRGATGAGEWVAMTPFAALDPLPSKVPASIALATDPDALSRVRFLGGRAPLPSTDSSTIEVALSTRVARAIGWRVGDVRKSTDAVGTTAFELTGVFEARDDHDPAWGHTSSALRPAATGTSDGGTAFSGTAYTAPGSFGAVVSTGRVTLGRAWYPLDPGSVTGATRTQLVSDTRRFLSTRQPLPATAAGSAVFTTDLPQLLRASAARDATVRTLAAALVSGPAGAVVALQFLLAALLLRRARPQLELLSARGARPATIRVIATALVLPAVVPSAVVGGALAAVVSVSFLGEVRSGPGAAVGAAVLAVLLPCAAAAAAAPVGRLRTPSRRLRRTGAGAVVVVAVASVAVTVRGGLDTAAPGGAVDPVAAVLPLALASCGALLAARVLPPVTGIVTERGRRRRGLGTFLGGAASSRSGPGRAVPVAVAVIGLVVALFATVVGSTLEHGVTDAARRSVAADVSVSAAGLDGDDIGRIRAVRGVRGAVGISTTDEVTFDTTHGSVSAVVLVADTAALRRVQTGVPGALPAPDALRRAAGKAVPVVVSRALLADTGPASEVLSTRTRSVAAAPDAVPFTAARRWVLVDERFASDLTDTGSVDRVLVRLTPGGDAATVASAVRRAAPGAKVTVAADAERALAADPRIPGARMIAAVAAALGGAFGVGALLVDAILTAPGRRRRSALLDVLGLERRRVGHVTLVEGLPTLVAVPVTAVLVAAVVVALTLPAADLRSFTGGTTRPPVAVDPALLGIVLAATLVSLVGVLVVTVRLSLTRRPDPPGGAAQTTNRATSSTTTTPPRDRPRGSHRRSRENR